MKSKQSWTELKNAFLLAFPFSTNKAENIRQLYFKKQRVDENLVDHYWSLEEMNQKSENILNDEDFIEVVISSMIDEFRTSAALACIKSKDQLYEFIVRLSKIDATVVEPKKSSVTVIQNNLSTEDNRIHNLTKRMNELETKVSEMLRHADVKKTNRKKGNCFLCNQPGHYARDCSL